MNVDIKSYKCLRCGVIVASATVLSTWDEYECGGNMNPYVPAIMG